MNAKTRKDREFISNLIKDRERFQPVFVRRFRDRVFKIIDLINKKIDSSAPLSIEKKYSLLNDLIDNLFTKEAHQLNDFLIGKRLVVKDKKDSKYVLVDFSEIYGDQPKTDEEGHPTLESWVYVKACIFVRTKLLVTGLLSRNINVIRSFLLKTNAPSCQPIISSLLFFYGIDDIKPLDMANDIAGDLFKKNSPLLKTISNYRYEADFYKYVKKFLLRNYIYRNYKDQIKRILNPVYPETKKNQDPSSDRVLREELKDLYGLKDLLPGDAEAVPELKEVPRGTGYAYDQKDADRRRIELQEIEYTLPDEDIKKSDILSYSDDLSWVPGDEVEEDVDYAWMLKMVFERMSRTAKGREQVEILKMRHLQKIRGKEVAAIMGVSESNISKLDAKAKEVAREIAIELNLHKYF